MMNSNVGDWINRRKIKGKGKLTPTNGEFQVGDWVNGRKRKGKGKFTLSK